MLDSLKDRIVELERAISEVETHLKSQSELLNDYSKNIDQLTEGRKNINNNILTLTGALQAYKNVHVLFSKTESATSEEVKANKEKDDIISS